ncbi:Nuclear protein MDM1 [Collichthys lucidus]|uniref:Nuclear protein MDM1 n=1 Tax=Collichthys lucidus TaxID=240159 RepID=A0A4U5VT38_COLLU|nr:Nuclear protein MDM1 [Collichthys lucidus]
MTVRFKCQSEYQKSYGVSRSRSVSPRRCAPLAGVRSDHMGENLENFSLVLFVVLHFYRLINSPSSSQVSAENRASSAGGGSILAGSLGPAALCCVHLTLRAPLLSLLHTEQLLLLEGGLHHRIRRPPEVAPPTGSRPLDLLPSLGLLQDRDLQQTPDHQKNRLENLPLPSNADSQPHLSRPDGQQLSANEHALRWRAGLRSGGQRSGSQRSEYLRQFSWKKAATAASPLLTAEQALHDAPTFQKKKNPVSLETEYRRSFQGSRRKAEPPPATPLR